MRNSTTSNRGRALLRDLGSAAGTYEVDYIIYTSIRSVNDDHLLSETRQISSTDIRPVNGYLLKSGIYALEREGQPDCRLKKTGALWQFISE